MSQQSTYPVLYFDGVCNLCNRTVLLVIRHDRRQIFRFAPLQSAAGLALQPHWRDGAQPDSVVLAYKGRIYTKSDAVLKVAGLLGGLWRVLQAGYILPRAWRNLLYDTVARNRYRWFGKRSACMIPTPELKSRFLD